MYFGDVDETGGILETLGRDQLLPRYRGGEGFAVGFGDNQLDQFRAIRPLKRSISLTM